MKPTKPVKPTKDLTVLESSLSGLFKTFIEGGIASLTNKHIKALSKEFQQNAVQMCETIVKFATDEEKAELLRIYNHCLKRNK